MFFDGKEINTNKRQSKLIAEPLINVESIDENLWYHFIVISYYKMSGKGDIQFDKVIKALKPKFKVNITNIYITINQMGFRLKKFLVNFFLL